MPFDQTRTPSIPVLIATIEDFLTDLDQCSLLSDIQLCYRYSISNTFCGRQRPLVSSVGHPPFNPERVEIRVDLSLSTYWLDEIGNMCGWAGTLTPFTVAKGLYISEEIVLRIALELRNVNNKEISVSLPTLQMFFSKIFNRWGPFRKHKVIHRCATATL